MSARLRPVATIAGFTAVATTVFWLLGLPSPILFGGLLGAMVHALTSGVEVSIPRPVFSIAQGLVGVTIGSLISPSALRAMAADAGTILLITLGTVVISVGAGRLLALRKDVSPITGAFALVAGGASGVVAVAGDLGADDRVVTVVQYLRVLGVMASLPVVSALAFDAGHGHATTSTHHATWPHDLLFVAVALGIGVPLATRLPIPTGTLLAPMALAAVLAATPAFAGSAVPAPLLWLGYGLIGVRVGLRFTRTSLASITRMLPAVLAIIAGMLAATAGMGAVLAWLTPVDGYTAYLATTPGGLNAVLAIGADSGADVTYVMAVQVFRLLVVLVLTPVLARVLARDRS